MYRSPVTIIESAIQSIMEEREGAIAAKIQSAIAVDVDKSELIRALQYDRGQYDKGYADGKADAMADLVRCKDCRMYEENPAAQTRFCRRELGRLYAEPNGFCSYGERRAGGK